MDKKTNDFAKIVFIIVWFLLHPIITNAQFSEKEKEIIHTKALTMVYEYESIINQIGEVGQNIDKVKSLKEDLNSLFLNNNVWVYNDLDPKYELSEIYEAETYTSNLILWYPDGISISINRNNIKASPIHQHEGNIYSIDLLADKQINGNYLNKTYNKNQENLTFRIAFQDIGKDFKNFKIVGIRNANAKTSFDDTFLLSELGNENIPKEERQRIEQYITSTLNDYVNYLSLIGDPVELEEDKELYAQSFKSIFNPSSKLYNDLEPVPDQDQLDIESYLTYFREYYPSGINNISLNIDSSKVGVFNLEEEGKYYTNCYVDKYFSGKYKEKQTYRLASEVVFQMSFEKVGNSYTNFKIQSVDMGAMKFYEEEEMDVKPELTIKPISHKGFFIGFNIPLGVSYIHNQNLLDATLEKDYHEWTISKSKIINAEIVGGYFFNNHLSIQTGIGLHRYISDFLLNGDFRINQLSTDVNYEQYYTSITADYDSSITLNYLSIPLCFHYISSRPGKVGLFIQSGINFSILLSAKYHAKGDYRYWGYYPYHPSYAQEIDFPELGFSNRTDIDEKGKIRVQQMNIALLINGGISIPFGYFSSIQAGPYLLIGLTDIHSNNTNFIDIFDNTKGYLPTKLMNYGFQIRYQYCF